MRTILLAAIATLGLTGSARAECRQEDDSPVAARVKMINGKPTIVIEKEIIICGHPPRPAVAYITNAKTIDYVWTQLAESFAGKIVDSVKSPKGIGSPFGSRAQLVGGSK